MAKGSSSSCWFACAVAHPFPFFLLPPLFLICVTASHSDKRFVHCVVGCGPFCFRAFTPSATHRDGRPCLPNTERGFLQVRRENLNTIEIRSVGFFWFFVNAFFPNLFQHTGCGSASLRMNWRPQEIWFYLMLELILHSCVTTTNYFLRLSQCCSYRCLLDVSFE